MDLLKECQGAKRIGITGHVRPDGDCVGSCLALAQYVQKGCPQAQVSVHLETPPPVFSYLKGYDQIDSTFAEQEAFDVFFVVDTTPERIGDACLYYEQAKKTINIDHHLTNKGIANVNLVCPNMGACCEVLFDIMEKQYLDADIALCLYTGIIHDTGVCQYSNTTPATMRRMADLMEFGFDFPKVILESFYQKTYVQSQIMGRALMESIRFMDGKCIVGMIDRKTMEFYNVTPKDFDGIVNQLRNIKGISCAIFMYETDLLEFKVSLRTDEKVDASKVASYFGGGGHMRAAGCTMKGTFHDCVNNLSLHIEEQLMQ